MKTFTVIFTTFTFLVLALLAMVIMQEEPEIIPPENVTSGIMESPGSKSVADPDSQRKSSSKKRTNDQQSETFSAPAKAPSPVRKPENLNASSGPSGTQSGNRNIQGSSSSGYTPQNQDSRRNRDTMNKINQNPDPSFTMTDQEVDDEVRRMRHRQMETLQSIVDGSNN